ncbi:immunoglobulin lambda variable 4-69 isoform X5 [Oryctolagus cuniculus]|uniref:immunoglobulin lambda variable 4-69 isoform X5 n=1 Tax=Oryctolagus cuniculus TaxID=9986 RepID=UPI0038792448
MACTPLLLLLTLLQSTGSLSQPVLTQSPSASATLGASAKLTCTLSSAHSTYYIEWYQQQQGEAPRYLMQLKSDGSYTKGTGVPDRFSGSSSGADRYLIISSVQAEDEADYICGVTGSNVYVFGGGTQLTVTGQPAVTPSVILFPPSSEELKDNKATLVCLINDFYPRTVKVNWKADGNSVTQGVDTTQPSKQSNNKYAASSFLSLSANQWKSYQSVTCQVTHEGHTVEKSLAPAECS